MTTADISSEHLTEAIIAGNLPAFALAHVQVTETSPCPGIVGLVYSYPALFNFSVYEALANRTIAADMAETRQICDAFQAAWGEGYMTNVPVKPGRIFIKQALIALSHKREIFDEETVRSFGRAAYSLAAHRPDLMDAGIMTAMKQILAHPERPINYPARGIGDALMFCAQACGLMVSANQVGYLEVMPHVPLEIMLQSTESDGEAFNIGAVLFDDLFATVLEEEEGHIPLLQMATAHRMQALLGSGTHYANVEHEKILSEMLPLAIERLSVRGK